MTRPATPVGKAIWFYALTLGLALLVRASVPLVGEAGLILTMFTPAAATIFMLAFIAPEGGFRDVLRRLGLLSPGFKAWPLAIGGPGIIHLLGLFILAIAGLTILAVPALPAPLGQTLVKILIGLFIGTAFALCEEVGWRGYMLPRLLGLGVVKAMLIVGFLHGVWHLPILLTTDLYHNSGNPLIVAPLFLITLTLAGIFYGFLRLWTASVWPVAVAHAAANMAWELSSAFSANTSPMATEYVGGESGLIMIAGLLAIGALIVRRMRGDPFQAKLAEQN